MHVLLIEPDQILGQVYARALQGAGHQVMVALSAQAGVHAADEQQPNVVILELELPNHNGVEFLYEFRSYSEWGHIPVIIHSYIPSYEYTQGGTLGDELGVTQFLYKPATSLAQLVKAVAVYDPTIAV